MIRQQVVYNLWMSRNTLSISTHSENNGKLSSDSDRENQCWWEVKADERHLCAGDI